MGIDVKKPRLGWQLASRNPSARGLRQTAYQVLVSSDAKQLAANEGDLWDSGEVESNQSLHVVYAGKSLASGQPCFWKARVRDQAEAWSEWSKPASWTMGLLERRDWSAKWIGGDAVHVRKRGWPIPDNTMPDPWFRKQFTLDSAPSRAMIYVASIGYHEVYVNGRKVGDAVLAPCATNHKKRARYCTYDIAAYLRPGENAIGLWLGTSWSIFPPYRTADKPASPLVLAQAEVELPEGKHLRIVTDETWRTHPSPNTLLGVWDFMHYGGELYDANRELPDWCEAGLDDSSWKPASVFAPNLTLSAQLVEPNRLQERIAAVAVEERPGGAYRVDMGVNFAGFVEIDLKGALGGASTCSFLNCRTRR